MDTIEALFTQDVNLASMFTDEAKSPITLPKASLRNRSAQMTLLTQTGENIVPTFNTLMSEGASGGSNYYNSLKQKVETQENQMNRQTLVGILANPNISIDIKNNAVRDFDKISKDSNVITMRSSLIKDTDTDKNEPELTRFSLAKVILEKHKANQKDQISANLFGAKLDDSSDDKAFLEALETTIVPFANNKVVGQIITDLKKQNSKPTIFDFIKAYSLAGHSIMKLREQIQMLPPSEAAKLKDAIRTSISKNSSTIFSKDSDYAKFLMEQNINDPEGYGVVMARIDDMLPLLDIIGLGSSVKGIARTFSKLSKPYVSAARAAEIASAEAKAAKAALSAEEASKTGSESIFQPATVSTPPVDAAKRSRAIQGLEEAKAKILGDSSQLLEPGQVRSIGEELKNLPTVDTSQKAVKARAKELQGGGYSYKEALAAATKEIEDQASSVAATRSRLEGQLAGNAQASKNEQRLAKIEQKIEELKRNTPEDAGSVLTTLGDSLRRIEWNGAVGVYNPSAVGNLIGTTNYGAGRNLFRMAMEAPDDQAAKAMFGSTKSEVVGTHTMPQAIAPNGSVGTRVPDIDRAVRAGVSVPKHVLDTVEIAESLGLTPAEKATQRANIVSSIRDANDIVPVDAMGGFSVNPSGNRYKISGVFGTSEGGFANMNDAMNQAVIAFRKYGVSQDNITILKREGNDHVPIREFSTEEGEYYIRVDSDLAYDPTNISSEISLTTKRNFFDRFAGIPIVKWLGIQRFSVDPSSMLDPILTRAASAASDRTSVMEKHLLSMMNEYATAWKGLDKQGELRVEAAITEANDKRIDMTPSYLQANFLPEERVALTKWREYWDTHYYLENLDLVRNMNRDRFMLLENSNVRLFAKEVPKNKNLNVVYDPTLDKVVTLTKAEMDDLYNNGGTLAQLRRPEDINGTVVEHIMVRNTPTEYLRKITDNDQVLNYIPGYYQIHYKSPKFIDKVVTKPDGTTYRKAVAVAGDSMTAENFINRMKTVDPTGVYLPPRSDKNFLMSSDDRWDLASVRGRIAQKHRGKLLEEADGVNTLDGHTFVADPIESGIRAARSISGRTMTRPMLENAKARFVKMYGGLLNEESGITRFPSSSDKIIDKGNPTGSRVADARTNWEYINYLENGYINSADLLVRGTFNYLSELFAKGAKSAGGGVASKLLSKTERLSSEVATGPGVTSIAKNIPFISYMVLHPLRQLVVQPQQALRLWFYDPVGSMKATQMVADIVGDMTGLKPATNATRDFVDFVNESGLLASIDKSNLVRGTLMDAADMSGPSGRAVRKFLNGARTAGFDAAESLNLVAHLAVVFDKYKRAGKNIFDPDIRLEMQTQARAISGEMNFAGDMSYNQGSFSFVMQFAQVPHKAWLQLTNRKLSRQERARLFAADTIIWGPPTALVTYLYNQNVLPESDKSLLRQSIVDGLQSAVFNALAREAIGPEQQKIDLGSLDPQNIDGWIELYETITEDGLLSTLINSPSGQIFLKDGGKIQKIISQLGRVFNPIEPNGKTTDELLLLGKEILSFAGGIDAAFKAALIMDTKKRMNQNGDITQEQATAFDALVQLAGFTGYDANNLMKIRMQLSKDEKKAQQKADELYKEIKRYYTKKLNDGETNLEWMTGVSGWILHGTYKDDPAMQGYLVKRLKSDMIDNDVAFFKQLLRAAGHEDLEAIKEKTLSLPEKDRQLINQMIKDVSTFRSNMNKVNNE